MGKVTLRPNPPTKTCGVPQAHWLRESFAGRDEASADRSGDARDKSRPTPLCAFPGSRSRESPTRGRWQSVFPRRFWLIAPRNGQHLRDDGVGGRRHGVERKDQICFWLNRGLPFGGKVFRAKRTSIGSTVSIASCALVSPIAFVTVLRSRLSESIESR